MCWRQVHIYTVPHIPTEVHSQLYKPQIPMRENGEIITYTTALKSLETLDDLSVINLKNKGGHIS